MPDLLKRFLILLRVANYGPNLADLARYNINAQDFPGNADLVTFISISRGTGTSEWDHLLSLDTIVKAAEATGELINTNRVRDTAQPITAGRTTDDVAGATTARQSSGGTNQNQNRFVVSDVILDETMAELLSAFAPNSDTYGQRPIEVSLLNVVQIAQSLGLTAIAPDGEPIPLHSSEALGMGFETLNSRSSTFGAYRRCAPTSTPSPPPTPTAAKKELQFHAMFLNPHHVELLFVLCTLLSGRRKINVQHKLASLGLSDILLDMYGRMSWESKPFHGHNPMEHIHGPGCDCNPESALRVQYLRLVNNSYDRDFLGDSNKMLLLSSAEKELLQRCNSPNEVSMDGFFIGSSDRGIFTRIVQTLLKEPVESVYRFWLSSCLESFLRGSGPNEQVFIAISGILSYTVTHIVDMGIRPSASANLQTAFDLLGELVKGNHHTIEMVDSALGDTNFDRFIDAAMSNLVDSNVFVRSLYLSIDAFSDSDIREYDRSARHDRNATKGSGYLSHSWIQYAPPPLSVMAINMAKNKNSIVPSTTQDSSSSNKSKFRRNGTSSSSSVRSDRRAEMQQSGHAVVANTNTPTPVLTSSRITYGVRGALQNIREAASHFLTFSTPISTTSSYSGCTHGDQKEGTADIISDVKREREKQSEFVRHNSQQSLFVPLMKENEGLDGDVEFDYDEFFTPPEAPHYPRLKSVSVKATAVGTTVVENSMAVADTPTSSSSSAFASVSASHTHSPSPGGLDVEDISAVKKNSQIDTVEKESTCVPAVLPKGLHRFHRFLVQEREYVLLRLMITVTIYNINHENICCLNTALLILLLAERR